jgi:uncharacterized protein
MNHLLAFCFGALFAVGLMVSGMSNPEKVLDFLDLFGDWDPSLAFVMLGAIMVAFLPFQALIRKSKPRNLFGEPVELPQNNQLDQPLIIGALLFGTGWGIAGICPAPSLTLLGLGHYEVLYFIVAMCVGIWIHDKFWKISYK